MDRAEINALGHALQSLLLDEGEMLLSFGAHGPSTDCRNGHVSAKLRRGDDEGLGEAVSLDDAIRLARGVLNTATAKRLKDAEDAKEAAK